MSRDRRWMALAPLRSGTLWMLITVIVGTLLTVYVFYPGFMSPDSVNQLAQARSGVFSDWHPPLTSWVWGFFDRLAPGPIGMLVFQSTVLWSGLGLWFMLIAPKWPTIGKSVAALAVGLFPSVFALLGTVWKDVSMAAGCTLGCALLLLAERRRSLSALAFGLLALWYALAVRHNAVVAVLPLVVYAGKILYEVRLLPSAVWRRRDLVAVALVGLGVLALMVVGSSTVKYQLTKGKTSHPFQQIFIHDLTAISIDTRNLLVPAYLFKSEPLAISDLERIYTPTSIVPLFCCDDSVPRLKLIEDSALFSELQGAWIEAVLSHPVAYIQHRIQVLGKMLGITEEEVCYPYHDGISPNDLGVTFEETIASSTALKVLGKLRNSLLFRAWIYQAVLAVSVAFMIWKRAEALRASPLLLAVGVSGLLYGLAFIFVSTDCSFRMNYWPVVSAVLLVVSLLLVRTESRIANRPNSRA